MTSEYVEMLAEDVPLGVFIVRAEDGMIMRVDDKYTEDDDEGEPWAVFVYEPSANVNEWVYETWCYGENVKVLRFR